MSSTIIDAPDAEAVAPATVDVEAPTYPRIHRVRLVAVAVVAAATLVSGLAWQAAAGAPATSAPAANAPAPHTDPDLPVTSVGAGWLSVAWDLTPASQRTAVCAQFTADPSAAWAAYSSAGKTSSIATRAEFSAFLNVSC